MPQILHPSSRRCVGFSGIAWFFSAFVVLGGTPQSANSFSIPKSSPSSTWSPKRSFPLTPLAAAAAPQQQQQAKGRVSHEQWIHHFWDAYNHCNFGRMLEHCDHENVVWSDYDYEVTCNGREAIELQLRLEREAQQQQQQQQHNTQQQLDVQHILLDHNNPTMVGVSFMMSHGRRACAVLTISSTTKLIQRVDLIREQQQKGGESSLKLLKLVSHILPTTEQGAQQSTELPSDDTTTSSSSSSHHNQYTVVHQYFEAWNRRNMTQAIALFAENVTYDDTSFPKPLVGKQQLLQHLELCASVFLSTFTFCVDQVIAADTTTRNNTHIMMALWHVDNNGTPLPFTRGCSLYELNDQGQIQSGLDLVEPNGPIKPNGAVTLLVRTLQAKLAQEPVRWIPLITWLVYVYVVFFSDGILPGANALALEPRTWQEVLDLSLNFFFVSPLLHLSFSPSIHPILESVFNSLLAWAGMFIGFWSDDRQNKPNIMPMIPTVIGMQFLTSAFLLPYLVTRSSEPPLLQEGSIVTTSQINQPTKLIGENRFVGPILGSVGLISIGWALFGRLDEGYGVTWTERWSSFLDLLSIDRVGSSFAVDLIIFAFFQGWLIDDDWKRRTGGDGTSSWLTAVGKYVPFFGLATYLALRPPLLDAISKQDHNEPNR